jgi:hypothetical protein
MYQKLAIRNRTVLAGMAMQAASQFSGDDGANE